MTLMTLVEITFLVSVTEYQAYTFFSPWNVCVGGGGLNNWPSLLTLGLHWEASSRSLLHLCLPAHSAVLHKQSNLLSDGRG